MPYISVNVGKTLSDEDKIKLMEVIASNISILPGETAKNTMINIIDGCNMYINREQNNLAFVDIRVLGSFALEAKDELVVALTKGITDVCNIPTESQYFNIAEMDGWEAESNAAMLLNGLGIETELHYMTMADLDGSQKVKVLLAQALFGNPDILLLDEPTNHLDLTAISWLENFLLDFPNTVIVVSHDRHFLNKVCTHICDVDYGKITLYTGNYDFWYEYTQMRQRQARDLNKKNEQKIKELQDFINRFSANAAKSKQATSRKKQLDALEMIEMPVSSRRFPYVDFKPDRECGNDLLRVDNLSKTIGDRKVLDNISFVIHPREKVAFVGSDVVAKTTLFKIIMGEMEPDEGSYKWGVTTSQSYFPSDNSEYFDGVDLNLVDWLRQYTTEQLEADIRGWLGRMLFSGDEALKMANVLSGGERVRCMLCKMMLSGANALIFDEPTNHLDLESIAALNNGLIRYPETVLFTSHDHQFVQTVADRIIEISGDKIVDRKGSYDDFLSVFDEEQLRKY